MYDFIIRQKAVLMLFAIWYVVGSLSTPVFFGVGVLSIILLWRKGLYFEILLGFFFILLLSDNLRPATDFAKIFKNVYMLLLTAIVIVDRHKFAPLNNIYTYFLPFVVIGLVGLYFSPTIFVGFQKQLSYILLFFAVPQFLLYAFRESGPRVIRDFLFFGVLMIIIGFVMRFTDPGVAISHGGRFRGVFGNPNGLGLFTSILLVLIVLGRSYFRDLLTKSDLRWLVIPLLIALVLSGSRTALLASILFLGFVRFYRFSPFVGFIFFIGAAVGVEFVSANIVEIVRALGLSEFFRVETLEQGSGRYVAWEFAWLNIQEYFWFGRGFAFDEWLMESNQDMLNILGHQGGVHNTYLIIWLNTGLVGLLVFFRAVFLLFIQASRNTAIAFPMLWLVMFTIALEPWLAASLNPFTILFLIALTVMTDEAFQPYIRGELSALEKPEEVPAIV